MHWNVAMEHVTNPHRKVVIQSYTDQLPIDLMGYEAGVCQNANVASSDKNYKRGLECLERGHFRVAEYPQVYIEISGYSARMMRELYTHIAGGPTRLQASTRYINYEEGFEYITPKSILQNKEALKEWEGLMEDIMSHLHALTNIGIPREDVAMGLPLGMESKMVLRTNLRHLIDMSHQRLCTKAFWEYRLFMSDLCDALRDYSPQWRTLVDTYFKPKCEIYGYCTEKNGCGRKPAKTN